MGLHIPGSCGWLSQPLPLLSPSGAVPGVFCLLLLCSCQLSPGLIKTLKVTVYSQDNKMHSLGLYAMPVPRCSHQATLEFEHTENGFSLGELI